MVETKNNCWKSKTQVLNKYQSDGIHFIIVLGQLYILMLHWFFFSIQSVQ